MFKVRRNVVVPLVVLIVCALSCQLILEVANIPKFIFPKPSLVLEGLFQNWQWLLTHLRVTVYEAVLGFLLGISFAIPLALFSLFFPALETVIVPLAVATINVPFVAIAPILFILLGYGPAAKVLIVSLVTFFPIMSNLIAGFHSVNQNLRERFYVCRAKRWQVFTKLELPAAIPFFVTGLQIGVSNTIIGAIVGELMGTTQGMGFVILMTVSQYKIPLLMAAVVVTTIASILLTWVVRMACNVAFRTWLINR